VSRSVRLESVSFRYPDGTRALEETTLEMRAGEVTALVGPAGSGKTTLASLVPRFLVPTSGRVLFDDEDAARATVPSLREQVAFVFQETALFDDTVAANIRLGRPDASDAEVRRAASRAGAAEFIERLPRGYDTHLGAGGELSVGQKQRLAIARARSRHAGAHPGRADVGARSDRAAPRGVPPGSGSGWLVLVIAHRLSTIGPRSDHLPRKRAESSSRVRTTSSCSAKAVPIAASSSSRRARRPERARVGVARRRGLRPSILC
jgi:ABC-type uncharacterized transport system YnjBCD ATPase subunit